jgi:hypothetical protein
MNALTISHSVGADAAAHRRLWLGQLLDELGTLKVRGGNPALVSVLLDCWNAILLKHFSMLTMGFGCLIKDTNVLAHRGSYSQSESVLVS